MKNEQLTKQDLTIKIKQAIDKCFKYQIKLLTRCIPAIENNEIKLEIENKINRLMRSFSVNSSLNENKNIQTELKDIFILVKNNINENLYNLNAANEN